MKKLNKKAIVAGCGGLLIACGVYANFTMLRKVQEPVSDLTLANIEAMAWDSQDDDMGITVKSKCSGSGDVPCPMGGTAGEVKTKVRF